MSWSALEQFMLELVNRARLDPAAEAARHGISLNSGLPAGTIDATAKQPLAPNAQLLAAARGHSQWMLDTDIFSHQGAGGSSPGERMAKSGYVFSGAWSWGENISWRGTTGTPDYAAFIAEQHRGLFLSAGHRENLLEGTFREAGLGAVAGKMLSYNALMVTQNFAHSGSAQFITGVVYDDRDGNAFYTPGEGRSGVTVAATRDGAPMVQGLSATAGGYAVSPGSGSLSVTFSGGGLALPISLSLAMGASNIKLDLIDGAVIASSATITLGANGAQARLLGVAAIDANGNGLANTLTGNAGDNVLFGAMGSDRLAGEGGNDTLIGGWGADTLKGGAGNDSFVFRALSNSGLASTTRDRIEDFTTGDRIDLSGIDADHTRAGNNAFTLDADGSFSTGEIRQRVSGADLLLEFNADADATAEMSLLLLGRSTFLGAMDFVL